MNVIAEHRRLKRRPVNLTIREDLLDQAKDLNLNASKAAERGILTAVRDAREAAWLEENATALLAHNRRVEAEGTLLTPGWGKDRNGTV